jgi:hypothetical protein
MPGEVVVRLPRSGATHHRQQFWFWRLSRTARPTILTLLSPQRLDMGVEAAISDLDRTLSGFFAMLWNQSE